jgi:hypothetical protein
MHLPDLILRRLGDLDYEVGLAVDFPGVRGDLCPGLLVVLVDVVVAACAGLDEHIEAVLYELADGLGYEAYSGLVLRYLLRYPYLHPLSSIGTLFYSVRFTRL